MSKIETPWLFGFFTLFLFFVLIMSAVWGSHIKGLEVIRGENKRQEMQLEVDKYKLQIEILDKTYLVNRDSIQI